MSTILTSGQSNLTYKAASLMHRRTVHSYSPGGSNVFPMKARWRHLANTIELVSYSPDGSNVPSHEGRLAPPGEYDGTCASFGPHESTTQTANRSVQPFCTAHGSIAGHVISPCPFAWGIWAHLMHASFLRPTGVHNPNGISVEPFLHRSRQSAAILYNRPHFPR